MPLCTICASLNLGPADEEEGVSLPSVPHLEEQAELNKTSLSLNSQSDEENKAEDASSQTVSSSLEVEEEEEEEEGKGEGDEEEKDEEEKDEEEGDEEDEDDDGEDEEEDKAVVDDEPPPILTQPEKEDAAVRLGPYSELVSKSSECENCEFFLAILHTSNDYINNPSDLDNTIIYLDSKRLDVREAAREDRCTYCCDDLMFDICVSKDFVGEKEADLDICRIIPEDPLDGFCMNQIRSWIEECTSTHSCCIKSEDVALPEWIIEIPSIQTQSPKLVHSQGTNGKYTVLSHGIDECKDRVFKPEELKTFHNEIDIMTLPKKFTEAITVTRKLGLQYLYISSICSPQTPLSPTAFAEIYLNCTLLLSATSSPDISTTFLAPRKTLYSPPLGRHRDRFYRLRLLRWKEEVDNEPLSSQLFPALERILAPRIVHFTGRQVMWECAGGWRYEAAGVEDKRRYGNEPSNRSNRKDFVQAILRGAAEEIESESDAKMDEKENLKMRLQAWHTITDSLSRHTSTSPTQRTEVASILATLFDDGTLGSYLAGIWSASITIGLAWSKQNRNLSKPATYLAPSWSWLGTSSGTISTSFLHPQEVSPEDLVWNEKYLPKLLTHDVISFDPSKGYGSVKEGSSITLSAQTTTLANLARIFSRDRRQLGNMDITLQPIFDRTHAFDCACCNRQPAQVESDKQELAGINDFLMLVLGRKTRKEVKQKQVVFLILRGVEGVFERVGEAVAYVYDFRDDEGREATEGLMGRFDEVEWVRKEVILV